MIHLLHIWRFGWRYLRPYRVRFVAGVLLGLLFGVTNASFIWASKTLTQRLQPAMEEAAQVESASNVDGPAGASGVGAFKQNLETRVSRWIDPWLPKLGREMDVRQVIGALCFLPLLVGVRGYVGFLSSYCFAWVSERLSHDLRNDVLSKLMSLSVHYFSQAKIGDLLARVTADTDRLRRTINLVFSDLIKEPMTILAVFVYLLASNWKLSVAAFLFLPVAALPLIVLGRKVRQASKGQVKASVSLNSLMVEVISGIRVAKAFNLENLQLEKFSGNSKRIARFNIKGKRANLLVNPTIETVAVTGFGLLMVVIFAMRVPLSDVVGLIVGVALVLPSIKKLGNAHVALEQTRIGVERLKELFEEPQSVVEPEHPVPMDGFEREIVLENVSFAYERETVIRGLSLTVPLGCKLGIAGASGSGKSTLINLLLRFYDPTSGRITMDGHDLRSIAAADLRRQMALVSQEVVLFDMSIGENIACGHRGATREQIERAARDASIHEFISGLPEGYDTQVGERGVTLSGGQRQRLAIARAFVKNAPILLLDEATAALDSKAEAEVQRAIEKLEENRTVICIAHRLSTLVEMDRILVLSDGKAVESGTFDELMKNENGEFARMAGRQGLRGDGR